MNTVKGQRRRLKLNDMLRFWYNMIEKINVYRIMTEHLRTLRRTGSDSLSIVDIFLFFGVPILVTLLLMVLFGLQVSPELGNALFTALSIFAGLLFNLLILVYDIVNREDTGIEGTREKQKVTVLREVFSNISYAILVSLAVVFLIGVFNLSFGSGLLDGTFTGVCQRLTWLCKYPLVKWIIDFLIISLSLNFTLTLLMVLRRVHLLLSTEFRAESAK